MKLHRKVLAKLTDTLGSDRAAVLGDMLMAKEGGLDIQYRDDMGRSLVFLAADVGAIQCLGVLVEQSAPLNTFAKRTNQNTRRTALDNAITQSKFDAAEFLLDAGASPRIPDYLNETPIQSVIRGASPNRTSKDPDELALRISLIRKLATAGCPVNQCSTDGQTALMAAVTRGLPISLISTLLDLGADPNLLDSRGEQSLHRSWTPSQLPIIELLVAAGADLNGRNRLGETPLFYAQDIEVLRALVEAGGSVHSIDNLGRTAFHHLLAETTLNPMEGPLLVYLLQKGIDPVTPTSPARLPWTCSRPRRTTPTKPHLRRATPSPL